MKTKLILMTWRGSASVDPRFSAPMLSWTVADICGREIYTKLSVGIDNGMIEAYNSDFELQLCHNVKNIIGMCKILALPNASGKILKYSNLSAINTSAGFNKIQQNISSSACRTNTDKIFIQINAPCYGMLYLIKDSRDPLLHIHFYECESVNEMTDLMHQMYDPSQVGGSIGNIPTSLTTTTSSNRHFNVEDAFLAKDVCSIHASNLKLTKSVRNEYGDITSAVSSSQQLSSSKSYTSGMNNSTGAISNVSSNNSTSNPNINEISPNHSQFFEVMYVGKIKVSHKRVPYTFIDDALPKFKAYDAQKILIQSDLASRCSTDADSTENVSSNTSRKNSITSDDGCDDTDTKYSDNLQPGLEQHKPEYQEQIINKIISEENKENKLPHSINKKLLLRGQSQVIIPAKKMMLQRDRSASIGSIPLVDQNRTMVFLIGKTDIRLISPDRKQVLLYKEFKDVASCAQGHSNSDHFGLICREPTQNDGYIGYVFKCQSESVADDIVTSISQAFIICSEQRARERNQIFSCEHCPMLWYHKLCTDVESLSDKKTQTMIFRRIELLSEEEQEIVIAKYYGAEKMGDHSLREQNQFLMMLLRAHCESRQQRHVHDTAENRSEFLNQYLGGSTIFMKAKRSLSSSFDHLLKRKNSRDDFSSNLKDYQSKEQISTEISKKIDIEKVDSVRPRTSSVGSNSNTSNNPNDPLKSPMMDIFIKVGNSPKEVSNPIGSWRQEILNRVVTPSKGECSNYVSPLLVQQEHKSGFHTKAELRELWRTAIRQTILLLRMEKENARLLASQNEHELKKVKLDYDEIVPCDKQAIERWETFMDKESRISNKRDPKALFQAIKSGVPRSKRGEIWLFLADQYSINTAPVDIKKFPNFNTPYNMLLKNLTEHQHAIFIDLGRTFPNHKYYKPALGIGQLSLFNILKAYSILDPELGYCQGLGFICGILLLHCEEEEAFNLLKHLMFKRQMRAKYLPDMKNFQLQLYQLSRLLKDHIPELYNWLDQNDVSPTLYAAPWILTIFSSQFPLGFVTRVFDRVFLESQDVIFKVAIALLDVHKAELLKCDNFEEIMSYLKNELPQIDSIILDKVMKEVFLMDIRNEMAEYQVEYNVLQEETRAANHYMEILNRETQKNQHLETQLQFAQSSIAQLEKTRSSQQNQIQSLQSQVQSLDVTVQILGRFIAKLSDHNHNIDLPGEIRRIVQHIGDSPEQRKKPIFIDRKIGKSVSVNGQLGFPLKVLEELNESSERESPSADKQKPQFFEHTYHQIRQQNRLRPNRLIDPNTTLQTKQPDTFNELSTDTILTPGSSINCDSGIATPLSPPSMSVPTTSSTLLTGIMAEEITPQPAEDTIISNEVEMHPLSNCDVNFKYKGTTQLKSIRPVHSKISIGCGNSEIQHDSTKRERS